MADLSCALDTMVAQEEWRRHPAQIPEENVGDAMRDAIEATRQRISQAFASQPKVQAKLRHS